MEATTLTPVELAEGHFVTACPGDWLISQGASVVDVVVGSKLHDQYDVIQEGVFLPKALTARVENVLGVGAMKDADRLLSAIESLATIEIGLIKIDFTPGQLAELKHRASKRGFTIEQELRRVVDRIKDEIFYRS